MMIDILGWFIRCCFFKGGDPNTCKFRDTWYVMCDGLMLSDILNLQSHWAQDGFQSLNPNRGLHGTMGTGFLSFNKVVILVSHWIANPHTWCNKSSRVLRHTVSNKLCPLKVKGKPKFWKVPQKNLTWIQEYYHQLTAMDASWKIRNTLELCVFALGKRGGTRLRPPLRNLNIWNRTGFWQMFTKCNRGRDLTMIPLKVPPLPRHRIILEHPESLF